MDLRKEKHCYIITCKTKIGTLSLCFFTDYPEEDDGSVNNILDAFGGAERSASISGLSVHEGYHPSWTVIDGPTVQAHSSGVILGTSSSAITNGSGIRTGIATMRELSLVGKVGTIGSTGTAESSGVGSSASGGAHSTNSSAASPAGSSLSQPQQNEDYEHVYCQLDPYFVSVFKISFLLSNHFLINFANHVAFFLHPITLEKNLMLRCCM